MSNAHEDLKAFISKRESLCGECKADLGKGRWIFLAGEKGALCLSCADLDRLVFLSTHLLPQKETQAGESSQEDGLGEEG
jgi:hypothetical protein